MEHEISDLCLEKFKNIDEKLGILIQADRDRNGRYDNHLEESISYRSKISNLEIRLREVEMFRNEARAWWLGIILSVVGCCFFLGGIYRDITRLNSLHPFGTSVSIMTDAQKDIKNERP